MIDGQTQYLVTESDNTEKRPLRETSTQKEMVEWWDQQMENAKMLGMNLFLFSRLFYCTRYVVLNIENSDGFYLAIVILAVQRQTQPKDNIDDLTVNAKQCLDQ